MDSLKATLAEKRKTHQAELSHASAEKKIFVRRGDVRQAQEEEEERRRAEAESRRQAQAERRQQEQEAARARFHAKKARQDAAAASQAGKSDAHASTAQPPSDDQAHQDSAELNPDSSHHEAGANFQVSDEDAIRRLRSRGEPIRLFGETSKERRLRLRALELMEQRGDKVGQNDFMDALGRAERSETVATLEKRMAAQSSRSSEAKQESHDDSEGREEYTTVKGKAKHRPGANMDSVLDLSLFQTDEAKVYPLIYYFLKGLLQEWAEALAARPDEVRSSVAGKRAAATQVQSESNLKPLFKQLRHRTLPSDMLLRIAEIVHYLQKREYRHANDSYLQLSIGNAPWPIGATSVGIHERSGREKIFSSKIAHVLNDEETRKYIQSLKRMMTFCQTRFPPKDVSMLMG